MLSVRHSVLKTISWRIVATSATVLISWAVTGSLVVGAAIGSIEFFAKMFLYYVHERAWARAGSF